MPVVVMNGWLKLKELGVEYISQLAFEKAVINIKTDGIRVTYKGKQSTFAVQSIALSTGFKNWFTLKAELSAFMKAVHEGLPVVSNSMVAGPDKVVDVKKAPPVNAAPVTAAVCAEYTPAIQAMAENPVVSYSLMSELPVTKLATAKGLYRPVKGTSPGSRYFLVADFGKFKMAIKWNGTKMSTRIEGIVSTEAAQELSSMGFTGGGTGYDNYWSAHADAPGNKVAQRYYGAMCAALGGSLLPMADISLLQGKGS